MFPFIKVAMVMVSLHSNRKTNRDREKFYCGYKGESRQREESRLNMVSRLNQIMRGGKRKKNKEGNTKQDR